MKIIIFSFKNNNDDDVADDDDDDNSKLNISVDNIDYILN